MKEQELRKAAVCGLCHRKILECGLPCFYRVRIERHGVNIDAVKRQTGLAMMLGGHSGLARVMGPDEDMTVPLMDPQEFTVCEECSTNERHCIAALVERTAPEEEVAR